MPPSNRAELTGIVTLAGTAQEVSGKLRQIKRRQVVAFTLPHMDAQLRDAVAQMMQSLVEATSGRAISCHRETLESLVDAFLPTLAVPASLSREAEMIAKARVEVFRSATWLTGKQIVQMAGSNGMNSRGLPGRWKRNGRIFAIKSANGAELFPAYGLDPSNNFRPVKELAQIIGTLRPTKDAWGVAYWFSSLNSFLGSRRPQDVLVVEPAQVVAAAVREAEGILHG